MIELIFGFFAHDRVPWILSALIVAAAVVVWLDFRRHRLEPVLQGLDEAIRTVEEAAGPAAFRSRFSTIHRRLAANPIVGEGWRAFAPTLAPAPGQNEVIGYGRRPHENLNEELVARAGVNFRLYNAVPNYLVGSGLFFTFLGLVAALYFASAGVAAPDVQVAQLALRDLLAAATFKFVTSIAGLGASMGFSWAEKRQIYRVHRRLGRLCAALEARMVPVTPESLAAEQLAELRQHGTQLRRLGRSTLVAVPHTIEERLGDELLEAMRPMHEALGTAAARLSALDRVLIERLGTTADAAADEAARAAAAAGPQEALAGPALLQALLAEMRGLRAAFEDQGALRLEPPAADGAAPAAANDALARAALELDGLEARLGRRIDSLAGRLETLARRGLDRGTDDALQAGLATLREARAEVQGIGRAFRAIAGDEAGPLDGGPDDAVRLGRLRAGLHDFQGRMRGLIRGVDERLARALRRAEGGITDRAGADRAGGRRRDFDG